jgi:hypothetical protein
LEEAWTEKYPENQKEILLEWQKFELAQWHSSWFHSPQATPPRGLALARSFFAKPGVPRRSSSLLPDQPPHD